MRNLTCGPEMTSKINREKEPHAFVSFVDGEKDCVPISHICKFPTKWRDGQGTTWDENYLYKVFWSPNEEDTPSSMLKKVAEIPTYELGESMEKPGYYRASVVAVKESLKDLEELLSSGKRISIGLSKYKYTSFDKKSEPEPRKHVVPNTAGSSKPPLLKKKKTSKIVKKRGINLSANTRNTASLRADLSKRYPHLISSESVNKMEGSESSRMATQSDNYNENNDNSNDSCSDSAENGRNADDGSNEEMSGRSMIVESNYEVTGRSMTVESATAGLKLKRNSIQDASKAIEAGPSKQIETRVSSADNTENRDRSNETDKGNSKRRRVSELSKTILESTSASSSDEDAVAKKLRVDPDYTPRKYERAKEEIAIQQSINKRVLNLNLKLQEKNLCLETRVEELELKVKEMTKQLEDVSKPGNARLTAKRSLLFSTDEPASVVTEDSEGNARLTAKRSLLFSTDEPASVVTEDSEDLETTLPLEVVLKEVAVEEATHPEVLKEDDNKLCEGVVIPTDMANLICSIPGGEKKDGRFVREYAIVAFGPETLASSSIMGTLKGHGKNAEPIKKSKLDPKIKEAVHGKLVQRVKAELKLGENDAKEHSRCTIIRFHNQLRDAQKYCRKRGYGEGKKTNEISKSLLKE